MKCKMQKATCKNARANALFACCILHFAFTTLAGCSLAGTSSGPPPTPTPPLAPYSAAIATAEAGGDPHAQAAAYYERGNVQLDAGAYAAAIADYDKAIALDASNARAFNNRALAHAALDQPDQALADYASAIKLDPGYMRAYQNRLLLLERRGDLKGIAADYHQ